jgi:phage host-nuclease inhibitor protein Gam
MTASLPTPFVPAAPRSRTGRVPAVPLPQSKADVETALGHLGALRGLLAARTQHLDSEVATLREAYAAEIAPIEADIAALSQQIQAWCETHRHELTRGGRVKFAKFANGTVSWQSGRARVVLSDKEEAIIAALKKMRLGKAFVRVAETLNKAAMLESPARIAKVPGLSIQAGAETFAIDVAFADPKERV